jgi:hypothetical protein
MIELKVDPASITNTVDYLEAVRKNIFAGVRAGMEEAMEGLAGVAVAEMGASGIQSRTGELAANILKSPRIFENASVITGRVSARGKMKLKGRTFEGFLGAALDQGFHVKAVEGSLLQFSPPGEGTLYSRGHVAFDVKPHPFLKAAADSFAPTLLDIITARVNEAIGSAA